MSRILSRQKIVKRTQHNDGSRQYQSTMDASIRVAHCFVMDPRRSTPERPLVSVVDDDESVRESLPDLLREFGFDAIAFSSAEDFLSSGKISQIKCLILDIAMPGMTGLELQKELRRRRSSIPIIFITGQKDARNREEAFRQGVVQFLYKPFSDTALLDALNSAIPK